MGRRKNLEHLEIAQRPHWLAVYNPPERKPIESLALPVGTNLRVVTLRAIARWSADGWTVENDGLYGVFFCNRNGERLEVRIQSTDPSEPVPLSNTSPFSH
jgi:hypothetical protein